MHTPYDPTKKLCPSDIPAGTTPLPTHDAAAFQAHLDAGNLAGTGPQTTLQQFRRHVRHDRLFSGAEVV